MAKRHDVPQADDDLQARLGAVIRTCRHRLGITQEELAWRANMHRTYIADIERGARNITLRSMSNLAKALQVTMGKLFSYADSPSPAPPSLTEEAAAKAPREILIIEDSAADAEMALRALKRAKFTNPLKLVRDAEEGLNYVFGSGRYAKSQPARPQLILLDLNLPEMSGLEFLRRVKSHERTRDIPVVVMAASRNDRVIVECGRLGAENFIVKPFGVESLVNVTPKLNLHLTLASPPAADRRTAAD